jgi:uncharacterized protein (TIGR02145 family)
MNVMKRIILHIIAATALIFVYSGLLFPQSSIRGIVKSGPSGMPVENAAITIGGDLVGYTDASGNYSVGVATTTNTLAAAFNGNTISKTLTFAPGVNWMNFWFDAPDLPSDFDGNYYHTVDIGTQTWMVENLLVTHFQNGDAIPSVTSNGTWSTLTTPGYCWQYNDIETNKNTFGALYNWYTVNAGDLCPINWHVPSDSEWRTLEMSLGMTVGNYGDVEGERGTDQGAQLKSTSGWPGGGNGTNISGFTALPGGSRSGVDGSFFSSIADAGYWWTKTQYPFQPPLAYNRELISALTTIGRYVNEKKFGFSIRCVQNMNPTLTTTQVSAQSNSAESGGYDLDDRGSQIIEKGVCWNTSGNPSKADNHTNEGSGTDNYVSNLAPLTPNTTYYIKAYATNSTGTAYGNEISFTTKSVLLPTVTTSAISDIKPISAISGGNVTSDGGSPVTEKGICWNTVGNPTILDKRNPAGSMGTGSFNGYFTGLLPVTTYYARAYATNTAGTSYGAQLSFTTVQTFNAIEFNNGLTYGTVADIEGNPYKTIKIGTQIWMAENLKTTKYKDGVAIPNLTSDSEWDAEDGSAGHTGAAYCWYDNNATICKGVFGALYNWNAVNTGKLCPTNWRVPTNAEWMTLITYLGGINDAGIKLKEEGISHWASPNNGADNAIGFTALAGGFRMPGAAFYWIGVTGMWWSSTEGGTKDAWDMDLDSGSGVGNNNNPKKCGFSVRCVKDADPTVVTNTGDSGEGSLRNALAYANSHPVSDIITFNILGSGPFTIQPLTALPEITDTVVIDGYSQPGATPATSSDPAIIKIEIDGENLAAGTSGFRIKANNCTIKGLNINRFKGDGILIGSSNESPLGIYNIIVGNYIGTDITGKNVFSDYQGTGIAVNKDYNRIGGNLPSERNIICGNIDGVYVSRKGNSVLGNYIGVDVSGKLALGNFRGVYIIDGIDNSIGGANPGERNIISSSASTGITIVGTSTGNKIVGNLIGVDISGKLKLGNEDCGIRIMNGASNNIIGGVNPGEGNVISNNLNDGILDVFSSHDNVPIPSKGNIIKGNLIGTDSNGTSALGNGKNGVHLDEYAILNVIGGSDNGAGNIIAFNGNSGILCGGVINPSSGNSILSNSIHSNIKLGIDLGTDGIITVNDNGDSDIGANNLQNFPVLTSVSFSAGNVKINGSLNSKASQAYTLQFFTSKVADDSKYGEGQTYLGSQIVTTDASGNATFSLSFPVMGKDGQVITATATDPAGNTSEFSNVAGGLADQELPGGTLHYVYNETGAEKITDGTDITALTKAFQTWSNIPTANIKFVNDLSTTVKYANASDHINLVSFVDDQYPWTPGVLAYSAKMVDMNANGGKGQITDADIIVNPEFANYLKGTVADDDAGSVGYYDIQSIITHEIGHNLGLLHSGVVNSTMFYWLDGGTTSERTLEPDDIAWASYKYPGMSYKDSYGTITGDITYGYAPNPKVAGALITATNTSTNEQFHSYSEADGTYVVPVSAPSGQHAQYYIDIQPLDGSVNGFQITPANISNYIFSNAIYFDYPNEYYNSGESSTDDVTARTAVSVSNDLETSGINIITNMDITSPTVVSITPQTGVKVEILPDIIIKFSEPVDITTFTDASCYLQSADNKKYFGAYAKLGGNSDAIIFTPDEPLPYNTAFVLHLVGEISPGVKGITDLKGNSLDITGLPAYSVTTIEADNIPPVILSTVPANGATGVFVTDNISVSFSKQMNKTSVQDNFKLSEGSTSLNGSFSWNNDLTTMTFTPLQSLSENASYTMTLIDKMTDLHGIRLGGNDGVDNDDNVTRSFTTVAVSRPKITYRGPADKSTGVTVTTPVVFDFTEPINTSTVNSTSFRLLLNGTSVSGSFEFLNEDSRVVFRPDADLQFGKNYTVTLSESIKDVSDPSQNLDLESKPTTTFTTAVKPASPSIYYIDAPSGAHGDEVTISGEGFDPNPVNNLVNFAGVSATVTGATLNSLTVKVPMTALSGNVNVSVKGGTTATGFFFYVIPEVLDLPSNWATSSTNTNSNPKGIALTTEGATAYITNPGLNTVSKIDMATLTKIKDFIVGEKPLKIDLNPTCTKAYVTNSGSSTISVIDLITGSVKEINVGLNPYGIAVTPSGDRVYVANYSSNNLSVIDINPNSGGFDHVVANVNTGTGNKDLKVTGDAGLALVAGDDGLKIVDINPKDAKFNCVVATASSKTKTTEVNPNGDATLAVVITEEGTMLLVDILPQSDFFGTAIASGGSSSNLKGGKPRGEALHIFVTTENNDVLVYEIGNGGMGSSGGSYAGKLTLTQVAKIPAAGNGDLIFDARNEKLLALYSGTGVNDGALKVTNLLKGLPTPGSGISGLIIEVRQLVIYGTVKTANGKELTDKLNKALSDLRNKKPKDAINDLNAFINKVKAQVPKNQGQVLIDEANAIIKQLQGGAKSDTEETFITDVETQSDQNLISKTKLGNIYPNPAKEAITINYEVFANEMNAGKVLIQIYDISGKLVGNLVNQTQETGSYSVSWSGRNDKGGQIPTGIYFIRLKADNIEEVKQILLIR